MHNNQNEFNDNIDKYLILMDYLDSTQNIIQNFNHYIIDFIGKKCVGEVNFYEKILNDKKLYEKAFCIFNEYSKMRNKLVIDEKELSVVAEKFGFDSCLETLLNELDFCIQSLTEVKLIKLLKNLV